jgi:hypothetical protein
MNVVSSILENCAHATRAREESFYQFLIEERKKPIVYKINESVLFHYFNLESLGSILRTGLTSGNNIAEGRPEKDHVLRFYGDSALQEHPRYVWFTDCDYINIGYLPEFMWKSKIISPRLGIPFLGRGIGRIVVYKADQRIAHEWYDSQWFTHPYFKGKWYVGEDTYHPETWVGLQKFSILKNKWEWVGI